jgi:hypothetical protein
MDGSPALTTALTNPRALMFDAADNLYAAQFSSVVRISPLGSNAVSVISDYDGDGLTDYAVWRPASGIWYILNSANGGVTVQQWGLTGDVPVPEDHDGDGKTDISIWRPSEGNWYTILSSRPALPVVRQWGLENDVPL